MHPAGLEELREGVGLGPCEAIACVARERETGRVQTVMQLRPTAAAPDRPASYDTELLARIAADPRGWYPLPDETTHEVWVSAWALRAAGLVQIDLAGRTSALRVRWRPANEPTQWRATVTDAGRRELARSDARTEVSKLDTSNRRAAPAESDASSLDRADASSLDRADASRGDQSDASSLEPRRVAEDLHDASDVERAIATCRARWANLEALDAFELERVLQEALPERPELGAPRTLLLVIDGRARAFERMRFDPAKRGAGGVQGTWIWRSMYVFTPDDVRRFAEGALR